MYQQGSYATNKNWLTRKITPLFFSRLRLWDQVAASRPDIFVAISRTVSLRVHKYYRRPVTSIIYPPVEPIQTDFPNDLEDNNYYLIVSRLVPYKQIDIAIKAFNKLKKPLYIVGEGEQKAYLQSIKAENVKMLGKLSRLELSKYYRNAKALIFPGEEDFGIVTVEAQSAGLPVIAFNKGGATETVQHGKTGLLYDKPSIEALMAAVRSFENKSWSADSCKKNAEKFSQYVFKRKFINFVEDAWQQHLRNLE